LQTLHRNQFPGELFWRQSEHCSGFEVHNSGCEFRAAEMQLISYTPIECINDQEENCKELVAYVRLDIKTSQKQKALL